MRTLTVSSLVVAFACLLLSAPAAAEPCSHPGSKKGYCNCAPPLTKVCGPVWNDTSIRTSRNAGAIILPLATASADHTAMRRFTRRIVPWTHPTPDPGMLRGSTCIRVVPSAYG
jgi:hypothetical protein